MQEKVKALNRVIASQSSGDSRSQTGGTVPSSHSRGDQRPCWRASGGTVPQPSSGGDSKPLWNKPAGTTHPAHRDPFINPFFRKSEVIFVNYSSSIIFNHQSLKIYKITLPLSTVPKYIKVVFLALFELSLNKQHPSRQVHNLIVGTYIRHDANFLHKESTLQFIIIKLF